MKRFLCILSCLLVLSGCAAQVQKTPPATTDAVSTDAVPVAATSDPPTEPPETTLPPIQPPDPLEDLLAQMTVEEKVGQLFLARCPDVNALEDIETYHFGGYILFGRDIEGQTPESLRNTISAYQQASAIPLLIAVDEEGGTVNRISFYSAFRETEFPSPRSLYADGGLTALLTVESEKCALLSSLGINVNMAPVCDVTTDPDAFMYDRSLGLSPEETGYCIAAMVEKMDEYHIGSVLKHFPGYGNNTDTHVASAVDPRPYAELWENDLVPFRCGIEAGCGAILVSHTTVSAIDENSPASLSPEVHRLLRENMGFEGVIVTDDLAMDAITDIYGDGECAVLAVLAGNDLICCTYYAVQYEAVLEAVHSGRIPTELLDSAVMRILRWKQALGLLG